MMINNMFDVITIGSATLDVFLRCSHLHANIHLSEGEGERKEICLPYGGKTEVEDVLFEVGGGATNAAVTFARMGLSVAPVAKIGQDFAAAKVIDELTKEKVNTTLLVQAPDGQTDFATILWAPNFGTTILVYRGKNGLQLENLPPQMPQAKWSYVSSTDGNIDLIPRIMNHACPPSADASGDCRRESRIMIAWNPGRKELEQKEKLLSILPNVDLLMLNKMELCELLNLAEMETQQLLTQAATLPCKSLIITDGHNGSYYCNNNLRLGGQGKWLHAESFQIERLETTGAGDAFGSAFIAGKVKGLNDTDCLKMGSANAASVVTQPGAKKGILSWEQMQNWLGKELKIEEINLS